MAFPYQALILNEAANAFGFLPSHTEPSIIFEVRSGLFGTGVLVIALLMVVAASVGTTITTPVTTSDDGLLG